LPNEVQAQVYGYTAKNCWLKSIGLSCYSTLHWWIYAKCRSSLMTEANKMNTPDML